MCATASSPIALHFDTNAASDDVTVPLRCTSAGGASQVRVEVDQSSSTVYYLDVDGRTVISSTQPISFDSITVAIGVGVRLRSARSIIKLSMTRESTHIMDSTDIFHAHADWRRISRIVSSAQLAGSSFAQVAIFSIDDDISAEEQEEVQLVTNAFRVSRELIRVAIDDWSVTPILSLGPATASHGRCLPGHEWHSATMSCAACAQDLFSPGDTTPCQPCAAGSWSEAGAGECSVCEHGKVRDARYPGV